jgi:hypothetical protein
MSRHKVVNLAAERIFAQEARRRLEKRSNKEIARQLAQEHGITLSAEYIGQLIADAMREIRRERNIVLRRFHGEQSETGETSGTIRG